MVIRNKDLIKLVEVLPEEAKQSAYDYLKFLALSHSRPDWDELSLMEPDDVPLSKEEKRQLHSNTGFLSWEEAQSELDLPADPKP